MSHALYSVDTSAMNRYCFILLPRIFYIALLPRNESRTAVRTYLAVFIFLEKHVFQMTHITSPPRKYAAAYCEHPPRILAYSPNILVRILRILAYSRVFAAYPRTGLVI